MRQILLSAVLCGVVCAAEPPAAHEGLNAVLWMQTSAEYRASAMQTYRAAEVNLMRALRDRTWTAALEQSGEFDRRPPAVILDLDETVLDNSPFQARATKYRKPFNDADWQAWVKEARAGLVPGALDFLNVAHANGVALFYVTNRVCEAGNAEDPTVRLLHKLRVPLKPGRLLCKGDTSDKSPRRALVAVSHRILLLIGDDFNDFVTMAKEEATVAGRETAANAYQRYWGERWFMLPNPTYGSWERAIGFDVGAKFEALRP